MNRTRRQKLYGGTGTSQSTETTECPGDRHLQRLREEIVSYLSVYLSPEEIEGPEIAGYIEDELRLIATGLCADPSSDDYPMDMDPDQTEGDYYRDSIAEYGTVYQRYSDDEDGGDD